MQDVYFIRAELPPELSESERREEAGLLRPNGVERFLAVGSNKNPVGSLPTGGCFWQNGAMRNAQGLILHSFSLAPQVNLAEKKKDGSKTFADQPMELRDQSCFCCSTIALFNNPDFAEKVRIP